MHALAFVAAAALLSAGLGCSAASTAGASGDSGLADAVRPVEDGGPADADRPVDDVGPVDASPPVDSAPADGGGGDVLRAHPTAGAGAFASERFRLRVSVDGVVPSGTLRNQRFRAHVGVGAPPVGEAER
jgi:hypothetical protein